MQAESYALEIAIHRKRAERERKRQELESEFAAVFQEVSRKKHALERLEVSIADMESTRMRKDREFARLQRNLMELLQEQKYELDALREKGIELETATATSAAAATATAMRAKEHERRSASMFQQTEELMKFQFMSMSPLVLLEPQHAAEAARHERRHDDRRGRVVGRRGRRRGRRRERGEHPEHQAHEARRGGRDGRDAARRSRPSSTRRARPRTRRRSRRPSRSRRRRGSGP